MPGNSPQTVDAIPQVVVKLDGAQEDDKHLQALVEAVVEKSLALPNACSLRYNVQPIEDKDLSIIEEDHFKLGAQVVVQVGTENNMTKVFEGEIVGIELDMNAFGDSSITIRCLDKMHRLHRERRQKTFQNVTDSDIFSQIISSAGLSGSADATSVAHDWVIQDNKTDWEMLHYLAKRSGRRVYYDTKTNEVHFKEESTSSSADYEMQWAQDVLSFRSRSSGSHQVSSVEVRGWDPHGKQAIVGTSSSPSGSGPKVGGQPGSNAGNQAFGSAKHTVVTHHVTNQAHAEAMAQSILDKIAHSFLEIDALCVGFPTMEPGQFVKFVGIGDKYAGPFQVTSVIQTWNATTSLSTQIAVEGKSSGSLLSLLRGDS